MEINNVCYEIVVPLSFNDGNLIPIDLLAGYIDEAVEKFGGCTVTGREREYFKEGEEVFSDDVIRIIIDTIVYEAQGSIMELAERIKKECKQNSVYVRSYSMRGFLV